MNTRQTNEAQKNNRPDSGFRLNAGTGMGIGALVAAIMSLAISLSTGDNSVWAWAIPTGIASGLAIGAGRAQKDEA